MLTALGRVLLTGLSRISEQQLLQIWKLLLFLEEEFGYCSGRRNGRLELHVAILCQVLI